MKDFGNFLRHLREEAQLDIAEAAGRLNLNAEKLHAWETGCDMPSEMALELISNIYSIPYQELRDVWEDNKEGFVLQN